MYPVYFSVYEMLHSETAFKKGIENIPSWEQLEKIKELALLLDIIREEWGGGITVNSGFRCERLNDFVGGSPTSQHKDGEAADIEARNGKNKELFNLIERLIKENKITVGQLIDEYNYSWLHISLENSKHKNEIKHIK